MGGIQRRLGVYHRQGGSQKGLGGSYWRLAGSHMGSMQELGPGKVVEKAELYGAAFQGALVGAG